MRLIRRGFLCVLAVVSILSFALRTLAADEQNAQQPAVCLSVSGVNDYTQAFQILEQINMQRAQNGLSALQMDAALLDTAMQRAAEISVYYSHTRPDGTSCFTAFPTGPYALGENIAIGYTSADAVMTGWMNSTGHRENILRSAYASVGVGVFLHNGLYTWVQVFSSQAATAVAEIPADTTKTARIQVLEQHLNPKVSPSELMLKLNKAGRVPLYIPNEEYSFHKVFPDSDCLTYHSDDPGVATVDAQGVVTAVAPGTANITVAINATEKSVTFPVTVEDHNYRETVEKAPTCGSEGVARYTCEDCAETKTQPIPKLTEHTWDAGKVIKEPTVDTEGEKLYTCTVCSQTWIGKISKLTPVPTEPATTVFTAAPTRLPATEATEIPTAVPTARPTEKPTAAPTVPATKTPTQPDTVPTQPDTVPTQPGTAPTETLTEPAQTQTQAVPTQPPVTQFSSVPATQAPALRSPQTEQDDTKIRTGVIVAAAAVLSAGVYLVFWKKKA